MDKDKSKDEKKSTESTKMSRFDSLIADLHSTDAKIVMDALARMPKQGKAAAIQPMIKTKLAWPDNREIQAAIDKILKELKVEAAVPTLIEALDNPEFDSERAYIISLFWNTGLFPVEYFETLIRHALRGDYMVAFEVLTVIDNSEDQPDVDTLQQMLLDVDEYVDRNPAAPHSSVLRRLQEVIKEKYNV
ncbi:MAG TPA: hypothetical protein VKY29_01230 [Cryomorphaceae bacterium]|nr:hypothetical protein [Cryomorphaceae bacterium]